VLIEVWRPGRHDERRPQHRRPRRPHKPSAEGKEAQGPRAARRPAPASTPEDVATAGEDQTPAAAPAAAVSQPEKSSEFVRPRRPRREGKPERPRPDRAARAAKREEAREERAAVAAHIQEQRRERREKTPDPNSPFAKLAALKEQLEANAKQRR
jgi:ATP-dependent RNA helicase SUPV3L1/SUV3